jgi:hypothetical protein
MLATARDDRTGGEEFFNVNARVRHWLATAAVSATVMAVPVPARGEEPPVFAANTRSALPAVFGARNELSTTSKPPAWLQSPALRLDAFSADELSQPSRDDIHWHASFAASRQIAVSSTRPRSSRKAGALWGLIAGGVGGGIAGAVYCRTDCGGGPERGALVFGGFGAAGGALAGFVVGWLLE